MTLSISDTLAMVKDTIAGVKILEQDSIEITAEADSAETGYATENESSLTDILDSVWAGCYSKPTIDLASQPCDTTYEAYVSEESHGVYGIPSSVDIAGSDIVTSLVLLCLLVTLTIFSVAKNYIIIQTKKFFGKITERGSFTAETINEVKLNIYFVIQTCLIFSITTYIFATSFLDLSRLKIPSAYIIPAAAAGFFVYFLCKYILYIITDCVFRDDNKIRRQHTDDMCYMITMQGLLLLPVLLLTVTTGTDMHTLVIYVAAVIVFAKLIAFYKAFCTFSRHYKMFLQIILYFCALEMIPLMSLCGILEMTAKYL